MIRLPYPKLRHSEADEARIQSAFDHLALERYLTGQGPPLTKAQKERVERAGRHS